MPFVKLDCGILDSTLWIDKPARELFVTALLMATPREIREPMQQLEVRSLRPTGFEIPPGWYGFIAAAGVGIINRALFEDRDVGLDALERLGNPEEESRSRRFNGRRLVRVDGGYLALNFQEYRDKDHTSAVRSKRYRVRHAVTSRPNAVTSRPNAVTHRSVTEAYGEAYLSSLSLKSRDRGSTKPEKAVLYDVCSCPHEKIIELYHEVLPMGRRVKMWDARRRGFLQARWREDQKRHDLNWWREFFKYIARCDFLAGRTEPTNGRRPFQVSLEWIVRPTNFININEGKYK